MTVFQIFVCSTRDKNDVCLYTVRGSENLIKVGLRWERVLFKIHV